MKRFMKRLHRGQKGFTLIELLIVVAILGIIAAVVIPNAAGFMTAGRLNAANTEVANVKTAAIGYLAENGEWPTNSEALENVFLEGETQSTYTFDTDDGSITAATAGWTGLTWSDSDQQWIRSS